MEPRDRFLAGVAALLIRNTAVFVEADFLYQGPFVNLGAAARPSGENTCGFPLVVGGGAGTFEGEFLQGVGDLTSRAGKEEREGASNWVRIAPAAVQPCKDGGRTRRGTAHPVYLPLVRQVGALREAWRKLLPEQFGNGGAHVEIGNEEKACRFLLDDPAVEDDQPLGCEQCAVDQRTVGWPYQVIGQQSLHALQRTGSGDGEDGCRHAMHQRHVSNAFESLGGERNLNHCRWPREDRRDCD